MDAPFPRLFGPIYLNEDAQRVQDADEEIFLLYSDLQAGQPVTASHEFRGLGPVDSLTNILNIDIELNSLEPPPKASQQRGRSSRKVAKTTKTQPQSLSLAIAQDVTSLRSRDGDTGSVVWKASVDLASLILQQLHYGSPNDSLFNKDSLREMTALELGAGTGILGLALHSWFRQYTITDTAAILPLLAKNVSLNLPKDNNVSIAELDWVTLFTSSDIIRKRLYSDLPAIDIIFAVDCVYHPSLMPAFVETIHYLSKVDRTTVVIAVELRDEDAISALLESWLQKDDWHIWRLGRRNSLAKPYATWVARRASTMIQ